MRPSGRTDAIARLAECSVYEKRDQTDAFPSYFDEPGLSHSEWYKT